MQFRAFGATLALSLWVTWAPAYADTASALKQFEAGDYAAVSQALRNDSSAAAQRLKTQVALVTGNYGEALRLAAIAPRSDVEWQLLGLSAAEATGNDHAAQQILTVLTSTGNLDRNVRRRALRVAVNRGATAKVNELVKLTLDEYAAGKLQLTRPQGVANPSPAQLRAVVDDLFMLAEAAWLNNEFQLANDAFGEIEKLAPKHVEAMLRWAELYAAKYASDLALQTVEELYAHAPKHPDVLAALAELVMDARYDIPTVSKWLNQALAIHPTHARALRVRAEIEIDRNQWAAAEATLATVLRVNPKDTTALALLATAAWLQDQPQRYEQLRKQALDIDPTFAQFYRIIARSAVREHRYTQVIEFEKAAVALNPKAYDAMGGVGLGYLRLGLEKAGLEWLEKAWAGDRYNARNFNTRNLFTTTIPNDYVTVVSTSFRLRYHKDDAVIFQRYITPMLEQAFAEMSKRYGFTPKTPVTIELYQDRADYAIRTTGLPDLSALGVCFGNVITAISPTNGGLNWGMVLWHELAHVFALQLSNNRVPRWFTEGLSEFETLRKRPEWRRENDADVYGALLHNTLPSIAELSAEFMQPDVGAVVVAYHLSSLAIEFLIEKYGFDKIVQALKLYGAGKQNREVLMAISGTSIIKLDEQFRGYLTARLAPYHGTFKLPTRGFDDVTKLEIAVDAAPKSALAHAHLALGHYYAGNAEAAVAAAQRALTLDAKQPIARFIRAEAALAKEDAATALRELEGLVRDGVDSYDIRLKLAQLHKGLATAEGHLCKAKQLDPERSHVYQILADFYQAKGQPDKSLKELEGYAMLEQMELAPLKKLMAGYAARNDWQRVRTYGESALFIDPSDQETLMLLGNALLQTAAPAQALYTFDSALVVAPPLRRPALAQLGRAKAFLALHKKAEAQKALHAAAATEPENAEVLQLMQQLGTKPK